MLPEKKVYIPIFSFLDFKSRFPSCYTYYSSSRIVIYVLQGRNLKLKKFRIFLMATQWVLNLSVPKLYALCKLYGHMKESYGHAKWTAPLDKIRDENMLP